MHRPRIKIDRHVAGGVALGAIGGALALLARNYQLGSLGQPGPGFMPFWVGLLLLAIGIAISVRALLQERAIDELILHPRVLMAAAGIVAFGLLVEYLGFVICALLLIGATSLAGNRLRPTDLLWLVIVLIPSCVIIFVVLLEQRFPVWPT
jgi:hypothetical protein